MYDIIPATVESSTDKSAIEDFEFKFSIPLYDTSFHVFMVPFSVPQSYIFHMCCPTMLKYLISFKYFEILF